MQVGMQIEKEQYQMIETVLYGVARGAEDWREMLLLTNATPEKIERVKALAAADGFHSFRVAEIDLGAPFNFAQAALSNKPNRRIRR